MKNNEGINEKEAGTEQNAIGFTRKLMALF